MYPPLWRSLTHERRFMHNHSHCRLAGTILSSIALILILLSRCRSRIRLKAQERRLHLRMILRKRKYRLSFVSQATLSTMSLRATMKKRMNWELASWFSLRIKEVFSVRNCERVAKVPRSGLKDSQFKVQSMLFLATTMHTKNTWSAETWSQSGRKILKISSSRWPTLMI